MEQVFFSIAGILIISTVLWFGFSLYRVRRSPEAVMEHWQKLTPADLQRLSQLCEMFFKDELQLSLNRKNLHSNIPALLNLFPDGVTRLKGYLICGSAVKDPAGKTIGFRKNRLYCKGEYFYGFSSILLSSFIGETLCADCNAQWVPGPRGFEIRFPEKGSLSDATYPIAEELAKLRNISSQDEKEQFEEYLLELCANVSRCQAQHN